MQKSRACRVFIQSRVLCALHARVRVRNVCNGMQFVQQAFTRMCNKNRNAGPSRMCIFASQYVFRTGRNW